MLVVSLENLDLFFIHKGSARKTGGFQLTQLFAQLLGLLQHGHVVALPQLCGLGQHGREVGAFLIEQSDLLLGAGDLVALLQQDAADALKADGEAHSRPTLLS